MTAVIEEIIANQGKRVVIHLVEADGSLREVEGKIEAASEAGFAFKEKGKSSLDLYEPDRVEEIRVAPAKPKSVLQKKLKPIELGQARQHLADRHGVSMAWLKENTEEAAFQYHQGLDHSDLGHRHEEVKTATKTERDEALESDGSDADED